MGELGNPRPENYWLYYRGVKKKDDKRSGHKGLSPNMWTGSIHDYYGNPRLPWQCDKCDKRFKYKNQVKDHKLEVHAY